MKQPVFSNSRITIFIGGIVAIAIIATFYFISRSPGQKLDQESTGQSPEIETSAVTPTPTVTRSTVWSPVSPPLSPVQSTASITISTLNVEEPDKDFFSGLDLLNQGEFEAAIEIFDQMIVKNPLDVFAYDARGTAYTALNDFENALSDYSKVLKIDPRFAQSYYNRGRVYKSLEMYDKAITDLQKSIELSPGEFGYRANGNIGLIYHHIGDYDKALEAFEQSISFNNNNKADVYFFRGETYTALENYDAAVADYQAAIQRFSNYDLAYQSLGYAQYKTGQFDEALQSLNQALVISPNSSVAHLYLALVYVGTDQFEQAKTEISQALTSTDMLTKAEQEFFFSRVLNDLEAFSEDNPGQTEEVESIIDLLPAP